MSDSFREYIDPIRPTAPIDGLEHGGEGPPPPPTRPGVRGKIVSIHRSHGRSETKHRLDVTVGAVEETEIVIRVPPGTYANWDGRDVFLRLDD